MVYGRIIVGYIQSSFSNNSLREGWTLIAHNSNHPVSAQLLAFLFSPSHFLSQIGFSSLSQNLHVSKCLFHDLLPGRNRNQVSWYCKESLKVAPQYEFWNWSPCMSESKKDPIAGDKWVAGNSGFALLHFVKQVYLIALALENYEGKVFKRLAEVAHPLSTISENLK